MQDEDQESITTAKAKKSLARRLSRRPSILEMQQVRLLAAEGEKLRLAQAAKKAKEAANKAAGMSKWTDSERTQPTQLEQVTDQDHKDQMWKCRNCHSIKRVFDRFDPRRYSQRGQKK